MLCVTLLSVFKLAENCFALDEYVESETLFQECKSGRTKAFGTTNHPEVVLCLINLGRLNFKLGKVEEAEKIYTTCSQTDLG